MSVLPAMDRPAAVANGPATASSPVVVGLIALSVLGPLALLQPHTSPFFAVGLCAVTAFVMLASRAPVAASCASVGAFAAAFMASGASGTITAVPFVGASVVWLWLRCTRENRASPVTEEQRERRRFQELAEYSPSIMFRTDCKGRAIYVNGRWSDLSGLAEGSWRGDRWDEAIHDEDRARVRRTFDVAISQERPWTDEFRFRAENGVETWMLGVAVPVYGPDGSHEGFVGSCVDISERRRVEEALRWSDARLSLAQRIAHIGSWEWRLQDGEESVWWSEEMYNILGKDWAHFDPPALLAYLDLVHPDDREHVRETVVSWLRSDSKSELRYRVVRDDGDVRHILSLGSSERDDKGRTIKLTGVAQDVTQRIRAEEERDLLEDQLRQTQKLEAMAHLAGGVAHDFNNLLTAILGNVDLILSDAQKNKGTHLDEMTCASLQQIKSASTRATSLTRKLLAFSRKEILDLKTLDARKLLAEMEDMLRCLVGESIELVVRSAEEPCLFRGDTGQIEQIVMNLVLNGADAMPRGGRLEIDAYTKRLDESTVDMHPGANAGDYVVIRVHDNGVGMAPDVKDHIFEPFFTTKALGKVTGLGLSTVYGSVKQVKGHLKVESELGKGSTFWIYLPSHPIEPSGQIDVPTSTVQGGEVILVVEDEEVVRDVMCLALKAAGYTVLTASHGKEAVQVASQAGETIDLLISDVVMPEMSGAELVKLLVEAHPGLRVLFVSGYTSDVVDLDGIRGSGVDFLQKPFGPTALLQRVRNSLDLTVGVER